MSQLLIIEDNPDIAELYMAAFADQETVLMPDIPQAIQYLSRHHPDLVITDFHLPSGTGLDIVTHLRRHAALADIPVLGISVDDTMRDELIDQGANAFMTKPIDLMQLINTAQYLLVTPLEKPQEPAESPTFILEQYLTAFEAAYHRRPDCYWTGRHFLIDRQRCDAQWLIAETARLKKITEKQNAPRHALLRLIDKLRRV
jgi:CheY-like chemotaxis protein